MELVKRAGSGFVAVSGAAPGSYLPLAGGTMLGDFFGKAAGIVGWDGRTALTSPADGSLAVENAAGTHGIVLGVPANGKVKLTDIAGTHGVLLDLTTDGQVTVRNRADSAYGTIVGAIMIADNYYQTTTAYITTLSLYRAGGRASLSSPADGKIKATNDAGTAGIVFDVSSDGTLGVRNRADSGYVDVVAGNIWANSTGFLGFYGRSAFCSPASGKYTFTNAATTVGAMLDFTTDGTLSLRNRGDTDPADMLAGVYTAKAAGAYYWTGRGGFTAPADGKVKLASSSGSTGVVADVTTDKVLALRDRAGTGQAQLDVAGGYVKIVRLCSVSIDASVATKQVAYTVPAGKAVTIVSAVEKFASDALTAATTGSIGSGAGATDLVAADGVGNALTAAWTANQRLTPVNPGVTYFGTAAIGWLASVVESTSKTFTLELFGTVDDDPRP